MSVEGADSVAMLSDYWTKGRPRHCEQYRVVGMGLIGGGKELAKTTRRFRGGAFLVRRDVDGAERRSVGKRQVINVDRHFAHF